MAWAYAALPWLLLPSVALLLVLAICYWPLRIDVSGRARGEPDGAWAVAGGMSLAGLSFAFVGARGVKARLTVTFWGRKLSLTPEWGKKLARPVPKRVKAASQRAWARVDPLDLGLKLLEERRHLRLRYLVLDADYGFRDPLLTGRLVGALSMLSAVLPPPIEIRHRPRWDFEDGWEISLDGRARFRPLLVLLDLAVHVVRGLRARRAPSPVALAAPGPSEVR
jgi:hypothetical protein